MKPSGKLRRENLNGLAQDGNLRYTARMESWTIFESFDPSSGRLYIDVVASSGKRAAHEGLESKLLESFLNFHEAHAFLDGYCKAIACGHEKPIREVICGEHEHPGCDIGPCSLGVTPSYRCAYRGARSR